MVCRMQADIGYFLRFETKGSLPLIYVNCAALRKSNEIRLSMFMCMNELLSGADSRQASSGEDG